MSEQLQQTNNSKNSVTELDPNMSLHQSELNDLRWISPGEAPCRLSGFPWFQEEQIYRRLPLQSEHQIPPAVHILADHTAGGQVAFQTNSRRLAIRVQLADKANMYHMPATGQCGFDLYLGAPGEQVYYKTSRFDHALDTFEVELFELPEQHMRNLTLNFPLYQGVKSLSIGIEPDAVIEAPLPYKSGKKVIIYGTSITQGGCASRPGMAYPNILSRRIPLEFINLGFSGSGRGEPEMARLMAEIKDPALLVLDYEANAEAPEKLQQTLPEFIRILREAHPEVPILVISKFEYPGELVEERLRRLRSDMTRIERETVARLRQQGDVNLHFHDGGALLGTDETRFECMVDGVHPTDLGFMRMAESLTPVFKHLLEQELA